jgi:hypothetical protein
LRVAAGVYCCAFRDLTKMGKLYSAAGVGVLPSGFDISFDHFLTVHDRDLSGVAEMSSVQHLQAA